MLLYCAPEDIMAFFTGCTGDPARLIRSSANGMHARETSFFWADANFMNFSAPGHLRLFSLNFAASMVL